MRSHYARQAQSEFPATAACRPAEAVVGIAALPSLHLKCSQMSIPAKQRLLLSIAIVGLLAAAFAPRIGQDPAYHLFADQASYLSIPNALNVLTNLLFAWVGCEGLYRLIVQKSLRHEQRILPAYIGFFAALILIALGSGYYHWAPDNQTLTLDRLPITIAFMSFFTILLGERISLKLATRLFPWLLVAGIASIVYWHYSELEARGDLRPYAVVQFLPVLMTPFILLMFKSRYTRGADFWWFLAWFLVARVCELLDREIMNLLAVISGHSLKHVTAAIGCLVFLRQLRFREALDP